MSARVFLKAIHFSRGIKHVTCNKVNSVHDPFCMFIPILDLF